MNALLNLVRHSHIRRYQPLLPFAVFLFLSIASAEVATLEQGKPVVRELSGGKEHIYRLSLSEDPYAGVTVEQQGIDVVLELLSSSDEVLVTIDEEYTVRGKEELKIAAAGDYRLRVKPSSLSAPPARYEIGIDQARPVTDDDRLLFKARRLQEKFRQAQQAGRYAEALRSAEEALSIAERILGPEDPFVARVLFNLGDYYEDEQDSPRSISFHERALSISRKTLGEEHPLSVDISRSLAFVYWQANEAARAEEMAQGALALGEKIVGPEHHLVARCLQSLGMATRDEKKRDQFLLRALSIAEKTTGPESSLTATVLNDLGITYLDRKDFAEAETYLLRSRAVKAKVFGPDNVTHSVSLLNLGMAARQKKDYETAEKNYREGIAIIERAFGPENSRLAMLLNNLANIYRARGEYERSLEAHLQVLRISEATRGKFHPMTLVSLGNIAKTYAAQDDIENALLYQAKVDAVIERNIELNLVIGSERQKLTYLSGMAERMDRTISLNADLAPDDPAAGSLAALTVLQRKGRVLDAMSESFASLRRRSVPEQRVVLEQFNDVTAQLAQLVLKGPQRMSFSEHQKAISDMEDRREQLEAEISRQSAEFRSLAQQVSLASIQAAIPSNAALLEFAVYRPFNPKAESNSEAYGPSRYIVYVVRSKGNILWRDLGETETIDASIDAFRNALRDPRRSDVRQVARALDEKLLQPVRPLLSDAAHLIVSPDGAINFIPIEALVDEHNRYLVERYTCTYLTSGRDLLRLQVARDSKTPAFVLANPAYGSPSSQNSASTSSLRGAEPGPDTATLYFAPLVGSAREAQAIGALFPEATFLTGAEATESALKSLSAPRILHIATHGFFLGNSASAETNVEGTRSIQANTKIDNPLLRSGLALAGANLHKGTEEDGILTALEASGLNLWGTKLVTLSACDTGVGEVKSGEGVYGLRRAFVLAGTETLVMSLWPVSDYITRELMESYYAGLKQGLGRREALRQVQLNMLQRKGREHPFYWASFIQSGEWANLDGQR